MANSKMCILCLTYNWFGYKDAYWHAHCRVVCFLRAFLIDFPRGFTLLCVLYYFVFSYFLFICVCLVLKLPGLDISVILKITG